MNEQIKQLAEQAGLYDFVFEAMGIGEEFEKFAELIVRECLEQIDKIRDGLEADNEDQQALGAEWAGLAVA